MKKTSIIITTLLLTISMWGATVKVTYGENITVSPVFTSGDMIEVGTRIDFTAANRETEGYDFVGFFADEDYTLPYEVDQYGLVPPQPRPPRWDSLPRYSVRHQPMAVNRYQCAVILEDTAFAIYAKYTKMYKVVYGDYISVNPKVPSGQYVLPNVTLTFTAANRETEGYNFVGFFVNEDCTQPLWNTYGKGDSIPRRKIADAEPIPMNKYVYTTTVKDNDISLYAKYEQATALINVNDGSDHNGKNINKFFYNGQLIIRKGDKLYNAVGAEL